MPPTESVAKLRLNRSISRLLLSSQALSSPLSMSSDCSCCHTTDNELSASCMQTVCELVAISVALHGIKIAVSVTGGISDLYYQQ